MLLYILLVLFNINKIARADCEAPCFEQLKAIHLRASPKQHSAYASADKNMAAHNRFLQNSIYLLLLFELFPLSRESAYQRLFCFILKSVLNTAYSFPVSSKEGKWRPPPDDLAIFYYIKL